jgi:hypothetical protein
MLGLVNHFFSFLSFDSEEINTSFLEVLDNGKEFGIVFKAECFDRGLNRLLLNASLVEELVTGLELFKLDDRVNGIRSKTLSAH